MGKIFLWVILHSIFQTLKEGNFYAVRFFWADVFWTPADWAWIGGLLDALLPCLYYGVPIVSFRARKFDPVEAMSILKKYNVTSSFMPPTALKMFRQQFNTFQHKMDSIGSGGETLGETLLEWGQEVISQYDLIILNMFFLTNWKHK